MTGRTGASPTSPAGGIVVGVDRSPGSLAALRWAIREGYVRGMRVHAVTAWAFPVESTFGDPAEVLMKKAEGAELLVIGSRGYERIFGALLGPVSQYVAAPRPVPARRHLTRHHPNQPGSRSGR